eukprot:scaffold370_cov349-Pavlova_lutheri.AAC.38
MGCSLPGTFLVWYDFLLFESFERRKFQLLLHVSADSLIAFFGTSGCVPVVHDSYFQGMKACGLHRSPRVLCGSTLLCIPLLLVDRPDPRVVLVPG